MPSSLSSSDDEGLVQGHALERQKTNETITHPGDVRINVKGAFIVDAASPLGTPPPSEGFDVDEEAYQQDPKGIRLPHHKAVVSHIAVDVSVKWPFFLLLQSMEIMQLSVMGVDEAKKKITNHADKGKNHTRLVAVLQSSSTFPMSQAATSSLAGVSISSNSRRTRSIHVLSLCVA